MAPSNNVLEVDTADNILKARMIFGALRYLK